MTVYWGYDLAFQRNIATQFPEFGNPQLAKQNFSIDHYPFDANHSPENTVELTRYWMQLFTHNRMAIWKGMLKIDLGTPAEDSTARSELAKFSP